VRRQHIEAMAAMPPDETGNTLRIEQHMWYLQRELCDNRETFILNFLK
jgi:hypothetical protein